MDIKYILLLSYVLVLAFADKLVYRKFPCLAEKNRYYHRQLNGCRLCDKCLAGEGTNLTAPVTVIETFGAVKCRPCIQCEPGTYNNRRSFKCKPCRDCAALGLPVKTACAPDRKETCGKRINVITTTASEPMEIRPTHHPPLTHNPPPKDLQRDREVRSDFHPEGQTVLNSHTHVNISVLVVAIVLILVVCIAVFGIALYWKCYRGDHHGCSFNQTNTIGDFQPIMTKTGWGHNTPSVVSEMQPQAQQRNHVSYGISNNVCTITGHEAGSCGSYKDYRYTQIPLDQNSETYFPTDSGLSPDVEEDAVPPAVVINDTSSSTGAVNTFLYTASSSSSNTETPSSSNTETPSSSNTETSASLSNLPTQTDMYQRQAASTLYNDSISASSNVSDKGKQKTDRAELERNIRVVSKYIAPHGIYQKLGRHLNISTTAIDTINDDYTTVAERAYRTLRKWKECNPDANTEDLKKGLRDIGKGHLLDKIT